MDTSKMKETFQTLLLLQTEEQRKEECQREVEEAEKQQDEKCRQEAEETENDNMGKQKRDRIHSFLLETQEHQKALLLSSEEWEET